MLLYVKKMLFMVNIVLFIY